ncbi:MAG TPA: MBL fold metallo-hydrolase [Candidatus Limnocylindrales bacterium]
MDLPFIETVAIEAQMPPGVLGPGPATLDVRCFLVTTASGIVLVDAGLPGTSGAIDATLGRLGAGWSHVTDIVLTHSHFDHTGGLAEAVGRAAQATVRAGALDVAAIAPDGGIGVKPLAEGDRVGDLEVLDTPGHTPGHISLLHMSGSVAIVGDLVGSVDGALSFGPPQFTADPERARASLDRVARMGATRLLFSHGAEVQDPNGAALALLGATL